ncbi:MAG TPA: DNA repair protein RadA, partial [Casimicrobiaceae bacterium]|nr:DNA repair protein RadA [Casimicrobiaceae bacterium]
MAKSKTLYACTECGGQSPKWQGQCPHCNAWNTLVETIAAPTAQRFANVAGGRSSVTPLASVTPRAVSRIASGVDEFDRVLG